MDAMFPLRWPAMFVSLFAICQASLATTRWSANLNFRSPSRSHALGIDVPKVVKRHDGDSFHPAPELEFTHGVASGDPYADSVILWTRVAPVSDNDHSNTTVSGAVPLYDHRMEEYARKSQRPICLDYYVSTNSHPDADNAAHTGQVLTSSDIDYTVKVEATGLMPWTQYHYRFEVCNTNLSSVTGRTKTAPEPADDNTALSLGIFSCADFARGYFNAYGNAARKDEIDYVIHLGDYIYELAFTSKERPTFPAKELYSLYDYRRRIATYRTDEDLLLSHSRHAWIPVWDDHDVADNSYRDGSSFLNNTEESFEHSGGVSVDQRKMNAVRAYFEWMPIRQVDLDDGLRIWRAFSLGKLVDLIMLDTRMYDRSITPLLGQGNDAYIDEIKNDASRTLMGASQESWFYHKLIASKDRGATWRLIGNQVIFSSIGSSQGLDPVDGDAWDGYVANRNRTLRTIYDNEINNVIMLSGDSHANWVAELTWLGHADDATYDPIDGEGAIGVEFAGTAITAQSIVCTEFSGEEPVSLGLAACSNQISEPLVEDNAVLQWQEGYYRGYYELHVNQSQLTAQYYGIPTVTKQNGWEVSLANFSVESGANKLKRPFGPIEDGAIRGGAERLFSNITRDTADTARAPFEHHEQQMYLVVSGGEF